MVIVDMTGDLKAHVQHTQREVPFLVVGGTVRQILDSLQSKYRFKEGQLKHANVFLNGTQLRLPAEEMKRVPDGSLLELVQHISGGC